AAEGLVHRLLQAEQLEIRLDVKRGLLDHAINRRRYWPLPTLNRTYGLRLSCIAMSPEPNGATDRRATVILLRRADSDAVIAAIWNYACHPTAVVPDNAVSADFPGAVRRALRIQFGDVPCLFAQGFCGDISPKMVRAPPPPAGWLRSLTRLLIQ